MKFDVIVGNPPYQESAKGESTKDTPVYNYFYDLSAKVGTKYCLISPARFLFNAGSTEKEWNKKMLTDKHISVKFFEQDSAKIFPSTDIKGGIAILYRDQMKDFGGVGTFTSYIELNNISKKVLLKATRTLDEITSNRGQYRYSDKIYIDYPIEMQKISDRRIASNAFQKLPDLFTDQKPSNNKHFYIQIYGRENNTRLYKWFNSDYLSEPTSFKKYKVVLPKANGSGSLGETLSEPIILPPFIGFTETFISIGEFDNQAEANNLLKYIKTKFARVMLGILKITQDNTKEKWAKVPLQDFSIESDINWNVSINEIDSQLYRKYKLNNNEIDFIEKNVKEMS